MANSCGAGRSNPSRVPALLPERAFVVEFGGGATRLSGRVEHVTSGQAARFQSEAELLEFVRGVLRSHTRAPKSAR